MGPWTSRRVQEPSSQCFATCHLNQGSGSSLLLLFLLIRFDEYSNVNICAHTCYSGETPWPHITSSFPSLQLKLTGQNGYAHVLSVT